MKEKGADVKGREETSEGVKGNLGNSEREEECQSIQLNILQELLAGTVKKGRNTANHWGRKENLSEEGSHSV